MVLSHQYSVASFAMLRVVYCLHLPGLALLFALQCCIILLWPWSMQFGDGYYSMWRLCSALWPIYFVVVCSLPLRHVVTAVSMLSRALCIRRSKFPPHRIFDCSTLLLWVKTTSSPPVSLCIATVSYGETLRHYTLIAIGHYGVIPSIGQPQGKETLRDKQRQLKLRMSMECTGNRLTWKLSSQCADYSVYIAVILVTLYEVFILTHHHHLKWNYP
jgi:hypothetical protein